MPQKTAVQMPSTGALESAAAASAASTVPASAPIASRSATVVTTAVRPVEAVSTSPANAFSRIPWGLYGFTVWFTGVFFFLTQLALGLAAVARIGRCSDPITHGPLADAAAQAQAIVGVRRGVALRVSAAPIPAVPLTYGGIRPVIVLPADASDWPAERLRAALLHEMAHVRRWDWPLQMLAQFVRCVYWFHPLTWLAAARARAESETACDDLVLASGMPAPDYARHLLDVALGAHQRRSLLESSHLAAVAMAQTPAVEGRLRLILAAGRSRREVTRAVRTLVFTAAAGILIAGSVVRLAARAATLPRAAVSTANAAAEKSRLSPEAAYIARGQRFHEAAKWSEAVLEFRQAVAINPNNAQAHYLLAQALYSIKFKRVGKWTYLRPAPPAVLDEAIAYMRIAIALRPNTGGLHHTLASYLATRGQNAEAIVQYRRAYHLLPPEDPAPIQRRMAPWYVNPAADPFEIHTGLGNSLVRTNRNQEAVYHYRQALRIDTGTPRSWLLLALGDALDQSGQHSEARLNWKKAKFYAYPNSNYWNEARARLRKG